MLLDFRVRNFRSFKDETILSMAASKDTTLQPSNTIETHLSTPSHLTRSAVIYGANAGGKTNLIKGLQFMKMAVLGSANLQPNQTLNIQPFKLDLASQNEPSFFEITVLIDKKRYQYGFELTSKRVISEWLLVYETAKPQLWLDRKSDGDNPDSYKRETNLTGDKRNWQKATGSNVLFLSRANQYIDSEALKPLYNWFLTNLNIFPDGGIIPPDFSISMLSNPDGHNKIVSMLSNADIAIHGISVEPTKVLRHKFQFDSASGKTSTDLEDGEVLIPKFEHKSNGVSAKLGLEDESTGTQKLFAFTGPILDILDKGSVLVVDELDRSLHPLLVRQIIEVFNNPILNKNGAQLIFTTHDASQLDSTLLRRDQIWFAEKQADQSSKLVPLSDFSPRKNEAFERGYLTGRYGGVPILNSTLIDEVSVKNG